MAPRKRLARAVVLSVVALVVVALMAVPGNATLAKKVNLTITPSTAQAGISTVFSATYTNKSLYKIGSTELMVPPGLTITGATSSHPGSTTTSTPTKVKVTNLSLPLLHSFTISVTATVACGTASPGTWSAVTKTGNDFSGSLFSLYNPGSAQKTTITPCPQAMIEVLKYEDLDLSGDRSTEPFEPPLEGWSFTLRPGASTSGPGTTQETGDGGTTVFTVAPGAYTVCETLNAGWSNTDPGSDPPCEPVTVGASETASLEFGNAQGAEALDCGGSVTEPGGGGAPAAFLSRTENATGEPADCDPVFVVLETGTEGETQFVDLFKNLEDQTTAQFTMEINWAPETVSYPLPATLVDFDGPEGNAPQPLEWCDPAPSESSQLYGLPGSGAPWCLVSQDADVGPNPGSVQVTEVVYGLGDPKFTRG